MPLDKRVEKYPRHAAKEWARETLKDYFVTTTMPFLPNLEIDEAGLRANVDRIISMKRVRGIYAGSIYQEFTSLTMAERKRVAEIILSHVAGRVPVMMGVSANAMGDVVELAEHAVQHGASLVMVWPPLFGDRTPAGVMEFYKSVAPRINTGICVYASGFSELGFRVTPDMLEELAKIENVCAVKEASWNIGTHLETVLRVGKKIVVSGPAEEFWFAGHTMLDRGYAPKVLLGTSRPLFLQTDKAPISSGFLDALDAGDMPKARERFTTILKVANAMVGKRLAEGSHSVSFMKAVTEMLGMAGGPPRPPLSPPPAEALAHARRVLNEYGIL